MSSLTCTSLPRIQPSDDSPGIHIVLGTHKFYRHCKYRGGLHHVLCFYFEDEFHDHNQLGIENLAYISRIIHQGEPRLELEAGTEAEVMACSSWVPQNAFLYNPGPPDQEWPHPQWAGSSTSITNQDALQTCLQTNMMKPFLQLWVPSSQRTLTCVKWTKT